MSTVRLIAEKLRYHKNHVSTLNPDLFDEDDNLIPEVREKLVKIVDEFLSYIDVDIKVLDVRLVGSNASYNYNPDSDIDLHIVTNLSEISEPETIARLFFDSVKKNFKDSYDIKIKGNDVELYVEDINASSVSNGIYSVSEDAWIKSPAPMQDPTDEELADAEEIEDEIIKQIESCGTVEELEKIVDKLYIIRKDSLSKYGETGAGNLAFKSIRGKGILEDIKKVLHSAKSRELSLEGKDIREAKSTSKLTLSDLMEYPYRFSKSWKSAPNPTYADDFLELAEKYNCLLVRNDSYRINFFICKDKSDYEELKRALDDNKVLRSFISLTALQEIDWDTIISKVPSIYVDKYVGGYSVKFPKMRK